MTTAKSVPKSADAFRTIGEAATEIGVPHHVLRFWETRFPQLQPLKRGGNRRYYRPADMALLRSIHRMLHVDGLTIRGAQKLLGEGVAQPPAPAQPASRMPGEVVARPAGSVSSDFARDRQDSDAGPAGRSLDLGALRAIRDRLAAALAA